MVTGGARGLGYEFCKAFLDSGCTDLAILDLKEDEAQAAAEELIKAACGQFDVPLNPSLFLPLIFYSEMSFPESWHSCGCYKKFHSTHLLLPLKATEKNQY